MPSNTEIKARVTDFAQLKTVAEKLSESPGQIIDQEDVFFRVPKGRLKLRILSPNSGALIFYERENQPGPKQSDYTVVRTEDPSTLRLVLESALGVLGVVRKTRILYWVGQTRIHLDEVEELGQFLELEVVMRPDQTIEEGTRIAVELMEKLGIREKDLIEGAYLDLLLNRTPTRIDCVE
ncbi:MAG: class IV adenylate cyclase [bacterium]